MLGVCVCVRACVRACVCAWVLACVRVCVCVCEIYCELAETVRPPCIYVFFQLYVNELTAYKQQAC